MVFGRENAGSIPGFAEYVPVFMFFIFLSLHLESSFLAIFETDATPLKHK